MIRTATGVADLRPVSGVGRCDERLHVGSCRGPLLDGRVHLVGDAVRVMPPTGGFGGNTAILDGYYLAWKLAMVLMARRAPAAGQSRPRTSSVRGHPGGTAVRRVRAPDAPGPGRRHAGRPRWSGVHVFFGYRHCRSGGARRNQERRRRPDGGPGATDGRPRFARPACPTGEGLASTCPHETCLAGNFVLLAGSGGRQVVAADDVLNLRVDAYRIGDDPGRPGGPLVHEDIRESRTRVRCWYAPTVSWHGEQRQTKATWRRR